MSWMRSQIQGTEVTLLAGLEGTFHVLLIDRLELLLIVAEKNGDTPDTHLTEQRGLADYV